ncbi:MAG TPA: TadE/TadG family type IV pilus assembly protein [Caulobacteraceae bacterium]|jgi:Flp pilus assembly protein TadG|nr:TadE/TadG family type IV pilus assembly protein [Caulobacteraceae bacterium]
MATLSSPIRGAARRLLACGGDRAGGVAVIFAMIMPVIIILGLGAVELSQVATDRSQTQDVADAAALWGARQLSIAPNGADQRTQADAAGQLSAVSAHAQVTVTANVANTTTMTVAVDTYRMSFFGNLLPAGGFRTHVTATAETLGQTPLCVLIMGPASSDNLHLTGASQVQAPCLVHGNQSVVVDPAALLTATVTEAGSTASGPISPAANVGAPLVSDPFAGLNTSFPSPCAQSPGSNNVNVTTNETLAPGVHCGAMTVVGATVVTLAPGEHYFGGNLTLKGGASITGTDVVMVFASGVTLNFTGASNISLTGRQSGPLAGFVMIDDRADTGTFNLQSDPITNLTGAIYVPNAILNIQGSSKTGQASDWTVVAARALQLTGSPNLIINAKYAGSSVPVPTGVGPGAAGKLVLLK